MHILINYIVSSCLTALLTFDNDGTMGCYLT